MNGKKKHVPYSIEVKIMDTKGRTVWKWRNSRGNLLFGLEKTNEYAQTLLGLETQEKRQETQSEPEPEIETRDTPIRKVEQRQPRQPRNTIIEQAFGIAKPAKPIFGLKRGGDRDR